MPSNVRVSSSIPSSDLISSEVARRYELGDPIDSDLFSHGRRDVYRVRASGCSYFLKVYEAGTAAREKVSEEVDALLHLQRRGVLAAYPIACRDGERYFEIAAPEGSRAAVLYTKAEGEPLSKHLNPANCNAYGGLLAKMHIALDEVSGTHGTLDGWDFGDALDAISRHMEGGGQSHRLNAAYQMLKDVVRNADSALSTDKKHMGICHGDTHDFNVHVDDTGILTLFDFAEMHVGWRAYDLATFLRVLELRTSKRPGTNTSIEFERSDMFSCWLSFVNGYNRVHTLTDAEQRAIYAFVPVRRFIEMGWVAKNARVLGSRTCHPNLFQRGFDFIEAWMKKYGTSI